jgi:hypothetical protein
LESTVGQPLKEAQLGSAGECYLINQSSTGIDVTITTIEDKASYRIKCGVADGAKWLAASITGEIFFAEKANAIKFTLVKESENNYAILAGDRFLTIIGDKIMLSPENNIAYGSNMICNGIVN